MSRDTQKTQHGIETTVAVDNYTGSEVETLRKPSTGLKPLQSVIVANVAEGRDTQKTQHGIETVPRPYNLVEKARSRHSENPARD